MGGTGRAHEPGPDGGTLTGLVDATVSLKGAGVVLRGVTITVAAGEILAVVGPSGAGKSTLLRAVAGLERLARGDVLVAGRRVTRLPPDERRVAMVFESSALVPFLDVAANLGWGLGLRGVPAEEADQRVQEQVRGLRLGRLLPRRPASLSSGEAGRVGIGRALVHQPSAFLFDEPLAHLDAAERWAVRRQIVETVRRVGVGTLYVTHDQEEAMTVGDRVALLDDGRVIQVGSPQELYDQPATVFAAEFFGTPAIGLLPARPVTAAGAGGYRVAARTLPLWGPLPAGVPEGLDVVLGVRPEHVRDARVGSDPSAVTLPARVVRVDPTGPDDVVTLEIAAPAAGPPRSVGGRAGRSGEGSALLRSRFESGSVAIGALVPIALDVRQAHVFDGGSGRALWHPGQT